MVALAIEDLDISLILPVVCSIYEEKSALAVEARRNRRHFLLDFADVVLQKRKKRVSGFVGDVTHKRFHSFCLYRYSITGTYHQTPDWYKVPPSFGEGLCARCDTLEYHSSTSRTFLQYLSMRSVSCVRWPQRTNGRSTVK